MCSLLCSSATNSNRVLMSFAAHMECVMARLPHVQPAFVNCSRGSCERLTMIDMTQASHLHTLAGVRQGSSGAGEKLEAEAAMWPEALGLWTDQAAKKPRRRTARKTATTAWRKRAMLMREEECLARLITARRWRAQRPRAKLAPPRQGAQDWRTVSADGSRMETRIRGTWR